MKQGPSQTEKHKKKPVRGKNGGVRPGSGRKQGTLNTKTRAIAEKSAEAGITPLEIMIEAMQGVYNEEGAIKAFPYAKEVAPYMHPKLASTLFKGEVDIGIREIRIAHVYTKDKVGDA